MVNVNEEKISEIGKVLCDAEMPLKVRFRALFTLKNLGGHSAIDCIASCLNSDSSSLLKHELAYCLGQMQDPYAVPILVEALENKKNLHEPIVRHEAGEALGAIGTSDALKALEKYRDDPIKEVSETCQLAIRRIQWLNECREEKESNVESVVVLLNPYESVDPTPAAQLTDLNKLTEILLDDKQPLYERYRAMFALRNRGGREAAISLAKGLRIGGALYRHEIAFVLGQMQEPASAPYLIESLEDTNENEMVRHECAEALGAIADERCQEVLKRYINDDKRVVRESCIVALDMCDYENSDEFQYANLLRNVL